MKSPIAKTAFLFITLLFVFIICRGNENPVDFDLSASKESQLEKLLKNANIPEYSYQVMTTYPHSKNAFTEGLVFDNENIYESTGLYGHSALRKIQISTGKILKEYALPTRYFAEGLTRLDGQLYQLTYHEHTGFVYDPNSFQVKNSFSYQGEGWGLTNNGQELIMSNGSSSVSFINPKTLKTTHRLNITAGKDKVDSLNEMEFINGLVYANIWPTSIIVMFSPQNGAITGWFNIKGLKPALSCRECVANGIAFDAGKNLLLVTGKNWPVMYGVRLGRGGIYALTALPP